MNKFSAEQEDTIKDLAGCFWDHNQRNMFPKMMPQETLDHIKAEYIQAIIYGLQDPAVWG